MAHRSRGRGQGRLLGCPGGRDSMFYTGSKCKAFRALRPKWADCHFAAWTLGESALPKSQDVKTVVFRVVGKQVPRLKAGPASRDWDADVERYSERPDATHSGAGAVLTQDGYGLLPAADVGAQRAV
jgi:hypothetical protein